MYPDIEDRLLTLWKRVGHSTKLTVRQECFLRVAAGCCSIAKTRVLLELEVEVNYRLKQNARSALCFASRKTSKEAAQLCQFLLLSGANPNFRWLSSKSKFRYPYEEAGARGISKWLGMTWDELVKDAKEKRRLK
ncbi:hypothetical protein GQ53DRAFT_756266 [Thozetella sp. PMI_491]|nr:hypothetical protein GQ53DRAFT_756266 [Thozetella sp. PMI_491]